MFNQAWSIFHYSKDELGNLTTAALKNILLGKDVISNRTALQECVMPFSRALNDRVMDVSCHVQGHRLIEIIGLPV
jgi:hypothetical protein